MTTTTTEKQFTGTMLFTPANGAPSSNPVNSKTVLTDTRIGSNNPRWKQQVRAHSNAGTHWSLDTTRARAEPMSAFVEWGNGNPKYNRQDYSGVHVAPLLPDSLSFSGDVLNQILDKASVNLILKARSAQQSLQALVTAGEFGQTLRMIRNPAKALFQSILDYSRRARRRARKERGQKRKNRVIANTYLEAVFGWLPLAADIEGAYKALTKLPTSRYRKVSADGGMASWSKFNFGTAATGQVAWFVEERLIKTASCRAYGEVKIETSVGGGTLQRFGIAASEFLPTVWELIPYSFLVDYFTNIGDVITAATYPMSNFAWHGLTLRLHNKRYRRHTLNRAGTIANIGVGFHDCGGSPFTNYGERTILERHAAINQISLSVSNIQFEIPGMGRKWLNLAALARARS